jgi:uncharacterized protein (TIGR01244 family)
MLEDIYNFLKLNDEIATAGQPTEAQIVEIAQAGYQVVLNLGLTGTEYALADEQHSVESLGMQYVHLPVRWENPTLGDLRAFCQLMQAHQGKKLFIHCAANMRVSAFMALYRTLCLGWAADEAFNDMERIWTPEGWWHEFIIDALNQTCP